MSGPVKANDSHSHGVLYGQNVVPSEIKSPGNTDVANCYSSLGYVPTKNLDDTNCKMKWAMCEWRNGLITHSQNATVSHSSPKYL